MDSNHEPLHYQCNALTYLSYKPFSAPKPRQKIRDYQLERLTAMRAIFSGFVDLLFPPLCFACDRGLLHQERVLCSYCLHELPQTLEEITHSELVAEKLFWRVTPHRASALFQFARGSKLQRLIHKIKYNNRPQAMELLGRYYGGLWRSTQAALPIDGLIPVPLHRRRLQTRGYNQSARLCQGMAVALGCPCYAHGLERVVATATQTGKTRLARSENVAHAFRIAEGATLQGKHLLLVDDLITTGATLRAAAHALLAQAGRVSVAVLAVAV